MELLLDLLLKFTVKNSFHALFNVPVQSWGPMEWGTVAATVLLFVGLAFAVLRIRSKATKSKRGKR